MSNHIFRLFICTVVSLAVSGAYAQHGNGVVGFATYDACGQNGVTGGGAGETVHVSTRQDLARYAASAAPYVIIIDKDIRGGGADNLQDELELNSDKTIIGAGGGKMLDGVALVATGKRNIIIRNITLRKGRIDGMAFHGCHHVWIDHCDLSDSYDGLLDITNGSDFFTVSWVKLHNHDKVSITNSGTCHYEDYGKEHVTFAHCMFKDNVQRNPRIGYGKMHIYNSYWENISSYCIGFHSQAQVLSENNHFSASAKKPFCNQYTDKLPYAGFLTDRGSYFANGDPGRSTDHAFGDITYTPEDFYTYGFDLMAADDVAASTPTGVGPRDGIEFEPVLNPGNGAVDVMLSQRLTWGKIEGATAATMYIGTSADAMSPQQPEDVRLQPATRYFWRVTVVSGGKEYSSPLYTFRTAEEKAAKPCPADGEQQPWLRYPSDGRTFCTPMPLAWRQAADAKSYRVYLAAEGEDLEKGFCGETDGLQIVPGSLKTGVAYRWRVDAVKNDGSVVKGDTWTFGTQEKLWKEGKNEAEKMYLSGIAFEELNGTSSGRKNSVGDQGPGAVCGTWGGAEGRYAIETAVYDQTLGPNLVGIAVNGEPIDAWMTSDEDNKIAVRKTRNTVWLKPGDDIRVDFVAGLIDGGINQSRARIDYVNFVATASETIETARPSGIHHAPVSTPGYDCEYLPVRNIIFCDTLATVGEKGSTQVKDRYCSWISLSEQAFVLYIKQTAMVRAVYLNASGEEETVTYETDKDAMIEQRIEAEKDGAPLAAIRLYKTLPAKTSFYTPVPDAGKDYQLIWSPDVVFKDNDGLKGNVGKVQIRDAYEEWVKYYNPNANEVQAKENVKAYIQPETDKASSGFIPKGKDGSTFAYVVGTEKYATLYLQQCSHLRLYYTGSAGTATSVYVTVVNLDTEEQVTYEGDEAKGKNTASAVFDTQLSPDHRYAVKIIASKGDMLVYAMKLWKGEPTAVNDVITDTPTPSPRYNTAGQRVTDGTKGIVIQRGRKHVF